MIEAFYRDNFERFCKIAMRRGIPEDCAPEVTQETFMKLCRKEFREGEDFDKWACSQHYWTIKDWHRQQCFGKRGQRKRVDVVDEFNFNLLEANLGDDFKLPETPYLTDLERKILELKMEGMSAPMIAEAVGKTTGTVTQYYFRIKKKIIKRVALGI